MRYLKNMLGGVSIVICMAFSPIVLASTVYLAEVDSNQSYSFVDSSGPYQLSGTLKIIVDGSNIQFENANLVMIPPDYSADFLVPGIGSYDGVNFDYMNGPPTLDPIPDYYEGAFDGVSLFLQGYTDIGTTYEFTINSSNVSTVPVPSSLLLFLSGAFGLFMRNKRKSIWTNKRE